MYIAILLLLLVSGVFIVAKGVQESSRGKSLLGALVILATILFFALLSFWREMLWFSEVGYTNRFWTIVLAKVGAAVAGGLFGGLVLFWLTLRVAKGSQTLARWTRALGTFAGALWGLSHWDLILVYLNRVSTGIQDPILGKDIGFYLFTLPFYDAFYQLLLILASIGIVASLFPLLIQDRDGMLELLVPEEKSGVPSAIKILPPLYIAVGVALLIFAWGKYLDIFHLMYRRWGAVTGPGWTGVHIWIPAYWTVAAVCVLLGLGLLISPVRRWLHQAFQVSWVRPSYVGIVAIVAPAVLVLAAMAVSLGLVPHLVQWLRVEPNEIVLEKPYIAHNIEFTRFGFRLHEVEDRQFAASERFTQETISANKNLLSEVRLWDGHALDAVNKQFQQIRLYYDFDNVDIDRYRIGGSYRQVMVSAREMNSSNLPPRSQTFVNKRFQYTHGYGLTLSTVSDFTSEGLPNFMVKDIPPKADHPELKVERPEIYYGELTKSHVVVNSQEAEFDYPSGTANVYTRYSGNGGVQISSLWRKFLLGWKFDGTRFFVSSYPTRESRLMFRRQIIERVEAIAPFLKFDPNPYIVLVDGRLYWIIDAYTTSRHYPYSERFNSREVIENSEGDKTRNLTEDVAPHLNGANYVRNSVKAIVNAYDGSVQFYVFEPKDAIIQVWNKILPTLFRPQEEMPPGLRAHVRYPHDFLLAQGLVYSRYHMSDPQVFYNQEDLWTRATEKYYDQIRPVEPYYIMWKLPGSDSPEFVSILPFTPRKRQVLIGWIAGLCDGENYGRMLAYKFPKEKLVIGPQQVDTKIDQDPFLAGQLTLWDQKGSRVIRGNVMAIPIDDTLLYVEPIYLQAETAAYPELRLVTVLHNEKLSYAKTLDEALQGLLQPVADRQPLTKLLPEGLIRQANEAFANYLRLQGEGRFSDAAREFEKLQDALRKLMEKAPMEKLAN